MISLQRLAVVLLCAIGASGCDGREQSSPYFTVPAEIGDVRDVVPATGRLIAEGTVDIHAPRPGVISAVYVREGDVVRAGQVLARLSAPTREPAQSEAVALAQTGSAAVREAEIRAQAARDKLDRNRTLLSTGYISAAAVRTAEAEYEQARAALDRARAEQRAASARVALSAAEGRGFDIVAPLAGTIVLVAARPGLQVDPADEQALFQTSQGKDQLTLEILIAESDIGRVGRDSLVSFSVDAYPDIRNMATLTSIGQAPIRDGRFTSYRALATYDNFAGAIIPGMSASVELTRADSRRVLRIPAQAIHYRPRDYMPPVTPERLEALKREHGGDMGLVRAAAGGGEFGRNLRRGVRLIFVLEDGQPVRREVRIGAETDEFIEVLDGLRPGEVVIVRDNRDPRDAV